MHRGSSAPLLLFITIRCHHRCEMTIPQKLPHVSSACFLIKFVCGQSHTQMSRSKLMLYGGNGCVQAKFLNPPFQNPVYRPDTPLTFSLTCRGSEWVYSRVLFAVRHVNPVVGCVKTSSYAAYWTFHLCSIESNSNLFGWIPVLLAVVWLYTITTL